MSAFAQFNGRVVLRGELQFDGVSSGHDYQIELADCAGGSAVERSWISSADRFEFDGVTPGCKTVRVVTGTHRTPIVETQVLADGGTPITIRVPSQDRESNKAEIVSAERLRHPMPKKAVKALDEASRLWQTGRFGDAAEKLRPLVAAYPEFWEIQFNDANVELKLGHVDAAAVHFLKAHQLQPRSVAAAVGAGFALLKLNRIDEAERALKSAIMIEPQNQFARTLLARVEGSSRSISQTDSVH